MQATPPAPSDPSPIMEAQGLSVFYGEFQAVNAVSLDVNEREVLAIIGPSGCGKSTLLRCFNRMNDFIESVRVEGDVRLRGKSVLGQAIDAALLREQVGMVFQRPNVFPKTIQGNIIWAPKNAGYRGDLGELVERTLREAALWDEVKDKLNKPALSLSGGQQQRLCIARALAMSPTVLLMDEPCSALDPIATSYIEDLIRELKQNYTVVIVTHNLQQAGRISDRTAFMYQGDLIEIGDTGELFTQPREKKTEDYITGRFG